LLNRNPAALRERDGAEKLRLTKHFLRISKAKRKPGAAHDGAEPMAHDILAAALLISARWPVFACDQTKRPITPRGFKDATREAAEIRRMFSRPGAVMIGVPTGAISGFFVVDVDCKNGAPGMVWLSANRWRLLPETRWHETRSGGVHLLFAMPEGRTIRNSASKIAPGIDIRGDGGFVIVPPSPGYMLQHRAPIEPAPGWLLDAIAPPPKPLPAPPPRTMAPFARAGQGSRFALAALDNEARAILSAADGTKHATINRAAFSIGGLVAGGELPEGEAFAALRSALAGIAGRCADFRAAEKTLARAFAEGKAKPRHAQGGRA
jgi:hypothetical protein